MNSWGTRYTFSEEWKIWFCNGNEISYLPQRHRYLDWLEIIVITDKVIHSKITTKFLLIRRAVLYLQAQKCPLSPPCIHLTIVPYLFMVHTRSQQERHTGHVEGKSLKVKIQNKKKKVNFCFWFIFFRKKIPIIERRDVTSCYLPNPIKFPSPPAAPCCNCRIMFCSPLTPPTFKAFYINKFSQNIF